MKKKNTKEYRLKSKQLDLLNNIVLNKRNMKDSESKQKRNSQRNKERLMKHMNMLKKKDWRPKQLKKHLELLRNSKLKLNILLNSKQ